MPHPDFKDYFSADSAAYRAFRPSYPTALFDFLADHAPGRSLAWDCATGNGQAALGLAARFDRVVATDASAEQIRRAQPHPRVDYRVALAERSGLAPASVDLVAVAQALHWLDIPAFFREVRRVMVPGGIVAAWCYSPMRIAPEIDRVMGRFYSDTVGRYWAPERRLVDSGYATVPFPFAEIRAPAFEIEASLRLTEVAGYVRTWSAVRRFVEAHQVDPVVPLAAELHRLWGDPEAARPVHWPIRLRLGVHHDATDSARP